MGGWGIFKDLRLWFKSHKDADSKNATPNFSPWPLQWHAGTGCPAGFQKLDGNRINHSSFPEHKLPRFAADRLEYGSLQLPIHAGQCVDEQELE